MARVVPPSDWIRHQVKQHVRPTPSSTTSRTRSSGHNEDDTSLSNDKETFEPSQSRKCRQLRPESATWHQSRGLFVVLLVMLIGCLSWTCWLLLLTMAPNEAINYVMRTEDLDHGSFWMLVEPTSSLRVLSFAGLIIVALGYTYIGVMLLAWARQRIATTMPSIKGPQIVLQASSPPGLHQLSKHSLKTLASIHPERPVLGKMAAPSHGKVWTLCALFCGLCSELWRKGSQARKIALSTLYQTLEAGFPLPLVVACTLIVVWNAVVVAALMNLPSPPSRICEAFVDSMSDFLVAVGFPVLVLCYCLATFAYDRASQRLVADFFPSWSFQNAARVNANPEQMAKVYKSLDGLRFQSISVCIARIGNNVTLLINLRRLVELLRSKTPPDSEINVPSSIYPRKHPLALVLIAIALGTVIFVSGSVYRSRKVCHEYPSCTIHAYRWWLSSTKINTWSCPCRVLIDVDPSPANFSAWKDPPDVTIDVANLAASGDLEILQLINRRLPELPDKLRRCSHLKHIDLVFTHTTTLPVWAGEFEELEFLHIEGKAKETSLASLPQGLFTKMEKLTFIHLGAHSMLRKLPDVNGLSNLRSITLARLEALDTFPAGFAQLTRLETMIALMVPKLTTFPEVTRARQTLTTLVLETCPLCCNGFLHKCDLSCGGCLSPGLSATTGTLELFHKFNSTICLSPPGPPPPKAGDNPNFPAMPSDAEHDAALERSIQQCDGILYRQCTVERRGGNTNSSSGICYSDRYMPISCMGDPNTIELRRQQIKRQIGPICNPKYETWLGCSAQERS